MNDRFFYLFYGFALAGLIALNFFLQAVQPGFRHAIISEGGLVESLSAVGYFVCVLLLFPLRRKCRGYPFLMFVLLVLGLRELDMQERFTTMSLTKSRFYISPEVPAAEKIIAVAFMLLLFYAVLRLFRSRFRELAGALRRKEPAAAGVATGIAFLLLSKTIDGLPRKLATFGLLIDSHAEELSLCLEETLELGIPVMFLLAIAAAFVRPGPAMPPGESAGLPFTKTS